MMDGRCSRDPGKTQMPMQLGFLHGKVATGQKEAQGVGMDVLCLP